MTDPGMNPSAIISVKFHPTNNLFATYHIIFKLQLHAHHMGSQQIHKNSLTSDYQSDRLTSEGILRCEIARSHLTLPQTVIKFELSCTDPQRAIASYMRCLADSVLTGPFILFGIYPHRLIVLLPRTNASFVDHFAY